MSSEGKISQAEKVDQTTKAKKIIPRDKFKSIINSKMKNKGVGARDSNVNALESKEKTKLGNDATILQRAILILSAIWKGNLYRKHNLPNSILAPSHRLLPAQLL